jgi:hypothetical protein
MPAYDAVLFTPPAPLGRVTLRNPATGAVLPDVPMLLDSGADVTLVPRECVTQLGVQVNSNDGYELMGFDGSVSVAQVADLHMAFLGRTFRGRFLLTDEPCGILGRNVLNSLSLVLDGPHLIWHETPT